MVYTVSILRFLRLALAVTLSASRTGIMSFLLAPKRSPRARPGTVCIPSTTAAAASSLSSMLKSGKNEVISGNGRSIMPAARTRCDQ
uniref:Putative secreted protein n=1 Tax=Ixodes ricinus TaxID=34613 RepID=A0A6B0U5C1_IXORI